MLGGHISPSLPVSFSLLSLSFVFSDCLFEISPLHPLTAAHYTGLTHPHYDHLLTLTCPPTTRLAHKLT